MTDDRQTVTEAAIEEQISEHLRGLADLRGRGARLLAGQGASGAEVMQWLRNRGASDYEARRLCVAIIHEARKGRATADDLDRAVLSRVAAASIRLKSPREGYGIVGDEFVSAIDAGLIRALKDAGLVTLASTARGEEYPSDGWPQPFVLTEAGVARHAELTATEHADAR